MIKELPWLEQSQQHLLNQIAQQRLPHALLFTGVEGVGKEHLMLWLARYLLCHQPLPNASCGVCKSCQLLEAGTHPDLLLLETEKSSIGVDIVRKAIQALSETAHQQGARVVVINQADTMTESAANALLKTLEEPGKQSFLLLDASQAGSLMPTIISRCQEHLVKTPEESIALNWLQRQGVQANRTHLRLCGGAPLRTQVFLAQGLHNKLDVFLVRLLAVLNGQAPSPELIDDAVSEFPFSFQWLSHCC